ncbi:hypothetical protein ROS1_23530 [Roseibium sp. ROS1]
MPGVISKVVMTVWQSRSLEISGMGLSSSAGTSEAGTFLADRQYGEDYVARGTIHSALRLYASNYLCEPLSGRLDTLNFHAVHRLERK